MSWLHPSQEALDVAEKKIIGPLELPVKASDQDFDFAVEAAESTGRGGDGRHEGLL